MLKNFFKKYFDYDIVASYLEKIGWNHYRQAYIRKYYLRCFKRKKKKRGVRR